MDGLSRATFLGVFAEYNAATWPVAVFATVAALVLLALARARSRLVVSGAALLLGALWLWSGLAYHWTWFARVEPAARLFAALFVAQGALLLLVLLPRRRWIGVRAPGDPAARAGAALVLAATILYPLLGFAAGHAFPAGPALGAPCPTTVLTFGVLLLLRFHPAKQALWLASGALLWSAIGATAIVRWGLWEDLLMPLSAAVAVTLWLRASRREVAAKAPADFSPRNATSP